MGYYVVCNDFKKDKLGNITEVRCSYDPETKGVGQMMGEKSEVQFIGFHVNILLMLR